MELLTAFAGVLSAALHLTKLFSFAPPIPYFIDFISEQSLPSSNCELLCMLLLLLLMPCISFLPDSDLLHTDQAVGDGHVLPTGWLPGGISREMFEPI